MLDRCPRRFPLARLCLAVVAAAALAPPAWGQSRLPSEIVSAGTLTADQEEQIAAYVTRWNSQLLRGSHEEVADARDALLQPIRSSTSDAFLNGYAEAIGEQIPASLEARRLITRVNAMIVAGELGGRGVRSAIVRGLADPSPAVNYWAARGVIEFTQARARGRRLSDSAVRDVLDSLVACIERTDSHHVLRAALRATIAMEEPVGADAFLDKAEALLAVHAARPELGYTPMRQSEAWPRLVQRSISARNDQGTEVLRRSARLAGQYMALITRQMESGALEARPPKSHREMLLWTQRLLTSANAALGGSSTVPSTREVQNALERGDVNFLRLAAADWLSVLQSESFGYTESQLALPEAP